MTILIKGIEMPKTCRYCQFADLYEHHGSCSITHEFLYGYDIREYETEVKERDESCPLVEVPTPHGRLKDVDVIIKDECHSCDGSCEVIECDCLNCTKAGCDTIRALNDAPTIIEAEEGK